MRCSAAISHNNITTGLLVLFVMLLMVSCNNDGEKKEEIPAVDSTHTPVDSVVPPPPADSTVKVGLDTAGPDHSGSEPSLPRASIAYAYKGKMNKGAVEPLEVHAQLDKPLEAVVANLEASLDERKAKEIGSSDTSIIKSLTVAGSKYFSVSIREYDTSVFFIKPVYGTTRQELNYTKPNKWVWNVTAKKEVTRSNIYVVVTSEDSAGKVHDSDITKLPVEITVTNEPLSKPKRTFIEKYGWVLLVAAMLVIVGLLGMRLLRKKHLKELNSRIYFSYAWKNEKETIIDKLYNSLKKDGFNVIRDKANLEYRGLISGFMKDIGKANIIIVSISDKYLRSRFCMFELYEIYRNCGMSKEAFAKKIFPIREEDINLSDAAVIDEYADYWKAEELEQEAIVKDKSQVTTSEQFAQYDAVQRIARELGNLLNFLSDINSLNIELLSNNDFAELKQSLSQAVNTLNKTA